MVTELGDPAARFDGEALDLASGLIFALDVCLSDIEVGEVLELSSTNPGLVHELPAWCRGTGHELVAAEPDGDRMLFRIRRGARGSLMFKDRPDWGVEPVFRRARHIVQASYVELQASHLSNVEAADPFTDAVLQFMTRA